MTDRRDKPTPEAKQALRIRRLMMATGASAIAVAVFFVTYRLDLLARQAFVAAALATLGFVVAFHAIFRTGMNLRFRDPSLTLPQIVAAFAVLLYVASQSKGGHGILALLFMMPLLFGVFRLTTRQLLGLTAFVSVSYALIVLLKWGPQARTDPGLFHLKVLNWVVLTTVFAFFSVMGGYITKLRKDLIASNANLEAALSRIESLAARDELTGVHNRRSLLEILEQQKSRADRHGTTFSVLMIDIDHFKRINDTYGHRAGDAVLKKFADSASAVLRGVDVFGRYGGEEFMAILEQATVEKSGAVAARMCEFARTLELPDSCGGLRMTVSIGHAQYRAGEDWHDTVDRADRALYRAKETGRDRIEPEPSPAPDNNGKQESTVET
jgi:diguanylate cyclase (GGDEF)-like protein